MSLPGRIGRYRVLEFLGKGAMGVVYRGRDDSLERDVALKVMSLGHGADAEARARFQREARAAARLQHPNIVTIYELGEHEGSPFMAIELLEGVDLQRAIEAGIRPNPKVTLPIVLQVLSGLGHAHEKGIIHRDVKPSNIFLPRGRPAKLMDFGVARLAGGGTTAGTMVGTPNYMSPEQVRGGPIDGRSDLFSAGLILYELVTGEKAYRADSVVAVLYRIAHEEADLSLIPLGSEWDRLRYVLARSLAREPEQRYPDAPTMAADLALALQDLGGSVDWAAPSDVGLLIRSTPRPSPALIAETLPREPPTVAPTSTFEVPRSLAPPPAPPAPRAFWRSPVALASVLGSLAAVALGAALFVVNRPAAVPLSASPGPPAPAMPTPVATPATSASPPSSPAASPAATAAAPTPTPVPATPRPAATPAASPPPLPSLQPSAEETPPPGPSPEEARLERAEALMEQGRYQAALAEAKAVLKREPGNIQAKTLAEDAEAALVVETRIRNAKEALKRGDKEGALEEIRAGLAVAPNDRRLIELFKEATQ